MNIVLFGSSGMLGHDFHTMLMKSDVNYRLACPSHADVHLASRAAVSQYLTTMKSQGFDTVINCAAVVDGKGIQTYPNAEFDSYRVNALGPKYLAEACARLGMRLLHISTDYVYSENSTEFSDYEEFPVNIYGYHKLIGELNIKAVMKDNYTILRVGCLYGMHRNKSFLHKFLQNVANAFKNNLGPVHVIDYQLTTPTSTCFVCDRMMDVLRNNMFGTYTTSPHGSATRYMFAKKIVELCEKHGVFGGIEFFDGFVRKESEDKMRYRIPAHSVMNELNRDTHLYGAPSTVTWENVLEDFISTNQKELAAWFKDLVE